MCECISCKCSSSITRMLFLKMRNILKSINGVLQFTLQNNFNFCNLRLRAGSGHYTTYARHEGAWYNFNDSAVSLSNEDVISHCKGYILFYTRQYPDINIIEKIKENIKRSTQVI